MFYKTFLFIFLLVSNHSFAGVRVTFSGTVNKGSIDSLIAKVEKALKKKDQPERKVVTISLNSYGGEIKHALRFVDYVQELNEQNNIEINTLLSNRRKSCDSSCTILFTAGLKRIAHPKAKFGFHSPRYESGAPQGVSAEYIEEIFRNLWLDYISRVDSSFAEKIVEHGYLNSHKMSFLGAQDLYPGYVTDLL